MPPLHLHSTVFSTVVATGNQHGDKVSELERRRLLHINRTAEYLRTLGLPSPLSCETGIQTVLRLVPAQLPISQHDVSDDNIEPAQKRLCVHSVGPAVSVDSAGAAPCSQAKADHHDEEALLIEASRQWLRETRAILLKPGLGGDVPSAPGEWHAEAVRRWGCAVPKQQEIQDWEKYVRSRLPRPPPPSILDIMQERYAVEMWRMLAACSLMTRISSERVKEETVSAFFQLCPNPSLLVSVEEASLRDILRPLGMVDGRIKTLRELSKTFLEAPCFDCGLQKGVNKIWGCGPFVVDSFNLFCKGRCDLVTSDATCEEYLQWWREMEGEQTPLSTASSPDGQVNGGGDEGTAKVVPVQDEASSPDGQVKGRGDEGTTKVTPVKNKASKPSVQAGRSVKLQQSSLLKFFKATA